jgi:hypothetical protein
MGKSGKSPAKRGRASTVETRRQRNPGWFTGADDARNGHGPDPGAENAGRPPNCLQAECRALGLEEVLPRLRVILSEPHRFGERTWRWAADLCIERGWGKAPQTVNLGAEKTHEQWLDELDDLESSPPPPSDQAAELGQSVKRSTPQDPRSSRVAPGQDSGRAGTHPEPDAAERRREGSAAGRRAARRAGRSDRRTGARRARATRERRSPAALAFLRSQGRRMD